MLKPLLFCCVAAGPALADGDAALGEQIYGAFCVACHGLEGRGDGPMRPVMSVRPADLTALARENGGALPVARIVKRIDGRDPLLSHGGPMPVYGDFFEEDQGVALATEAGQPVLTSQPIADLVEWLRVIQE